LRVSSRRPPFASPLKFASLPCQSPWETDDTGFCQWRRQIVQDSGVKVYQSG
jgi:hypothetical protein